MANANSPRAATTLEDFVSKVDCLSYNEARRATAYEK
jgi:hypothetical protein